MHSDTLKHTRVSTTRRWARTGGRHPLMIGAALCAAFIAGPAAAEMGRDAIIEKALSAAPPQLRAEATVVGPDGAVLKEGSGPFTCMLTPVEPTGSAPMCADKTWMPWAEAWVNGTPYEGPDRIGLAYMLAGDTAEGGASNTDPMAKKPTADNQWVVEGPHVMIIAPDESLLAGISDDPDSGGPYVMWKGTPFAHVMLPVGERPDQRQVAEQ